MARSALPSSDHPVLLRKPGQPGNRMWLAFVATFASVVAALAIAGGILAVSRRLGSTSITTTMDLGNAQIPAFVSKSSLITDAHYSGALVTFAGVDDATRWLFAAADVCAAVTVLGIAVAVLILSAKILRGRTFARSVTWTLTANGFLIMVLGVAQQYLDAQGKASLVRMVGMNLTAGGTQSGPYEGFIAYGLSLDLMPVGVGLAFLVLATAFSVGLRLQRDTEGLV